MPVRRQASARETAGYSRGSAAVQLEWERQHTTKSEWEGVAMRLVGLEYSGRGWEGAAVVG